MNGAQDRTRTCTGFLPQAPQACVSANSTTWATFVLLYGILDLLRNEPLHDSVKAFRCKLQTAQGDRYALDCVYSARVLTMRFPVVFGAWAS